MKKIRLNSKTEEYTVKFWIKNKETGFVEQKEESVFSFGKADHEKVQKEIENKYRGKGFKIRVVSVIYV